MIYVHENYIVSIIIYIFYLSVCFIDPTTALKNKSTYFITSTMKTSLILTKQPFTSNIAFSKIAITSHLLPTPSTKTITSSISPPVTGTKTPNPKTTLEPITPHTPLFHATVTLTLVWEEFCKYTKKFRDGVAKLISEKTKKKQDADQVIIMNLNQCIRGKKEDAIVKFYIITKSTKQPNENLTHVAVSELQILIRNNNTAKLAKQFDNKIVSVIFVSIPHKENGKELQIWVILVIAFGSLLLLLWLLCCCYIFCRKKSVPEVKYVLQPIEQTANEKPPGEGKAPPADQTDDQKPPDEEKKPSADETDLEEKSTYKSAVSITVKPKPTNLGEMNPTYEMDHESEKNNEFKPTNATLVSLKTGETTDSKNEENESNTKVYADGELHEDSLNEDKNAGTTYI